MDEILKSRKRVFVERTVWSTLMAFFLIFMFHYFTSINIHVYSGIKVYIMPLWIILLINILFRGLLWLDRRLDRSIPWYYYPRKRLITEIAIAFPSVLAILSFNYLFMFSVSNPSINMISHQRFLYTYIILMIVLGVAIIIVIANNFFHNWQKSLLEVEQLKRDKIKSDYQALQNQLNPHFLFNIFNMLIAEIRRDPDNAERITERLSDVYRYVLESKNHETTSLREEVEFAEAILFLYKIRFGDSLVVECQLPAEVMSYRLPPLTLQILIENALKHNVMSASHPLHLRITVEDGYLLTTNDIQPRKSTYSTYVGLENIKMRFSYLTERRVIVNVSDNQFKVKVPLLKE